MPAHYKILRDDTKLKCPNCGTRIYDVNHQFCEFCGTELSSIKDTNNSKSEKT